MEILRHLEPIMFDQNSIIVKQNKEFNEVIFLNEGSIEVGYNVDYFLYETGTISATEARSSYIMSKTSKSFNLKMDEHNRKKFQFPVSVS